MKVYTYVLSLLVSLVIQDGECQDDPYEALYVTPRDTDCAPEATKAGQRFLFTNYRALYDYRKYHHDFTRFEADKKVGELDQQTPDGKKDELGNKDMDGSVVFFNWDDNHGVVRISCPCGTRIEANDSAEFNKEEALYRPKYRKDEVGWKMYGKGSAKFNKKYGDDRTNPLQLAPPTVRYYYRTFECYMLKDKTKKHYINVFTRPTGYTTFPVGYLKGPKGLDRYPQEPIHCALHQYYREFAKELKEKDTYFGVPFQFYWKFPGESDEEKKLEKSHRELEYQRPPHGDIFWGAQTLDKEKPAAVYVEQTPKIKVTFENEKNRPKKEKIEKEHTSYDDVEHHDYICKERIDIKVPTVLRTRLHFNPKVPIHDDLRGKYACIVVDVNGLSSAWWWDGDLAPKNPYRGFVLVHVRDFQYAFIALGAIGTFVFVVGLLILVLPDNTEDFREDDPSQESAPASGSAAPPPAAVAAGAPMDKPTAKAAEVPPAPVYQAPPPPPPPPPRNPSVSLSIKSVHSNKVAPEEMKGVPKKRKKK